METKTNDKSVAVVGSGYWGKNLVRNFYELHALNTICDENESTLKDCRERYPGVKTTRFFEDVLKRDDIPAVAIATPAETHFPLAYKSLLNNKHVFIEKPLSLEVEEGRELVELAEKQNKKLMVGHILQYHPGILKLKELIDKGELGKIQYLYSNRLNIGKIRTEENILWSFAPHDISVMLMLLGIMPDGVYSVGGSYLQHKIPDTTMTIMDFPDQVKGHIFVSWLHPFKEQKLVIIGDRKMAVFDDLRDNKIKLYPHEIKWLERIPIASKAEAEIVKVDWIEPLKSECSHFLDCIKGNQDPKTDGREGLRVLQVLESAQKSLDNGGVYVSINNRSGQKYSVPPVRSKKINEKTPIENEDFFIHESSILDERVKIGKGTRIWHFSHVLSQSEIGDNCNIGQNVCIGPDVTIGNGCKIQNNVHIFKGITLEDNVFCGPSMVFTNVIDPRAELYKMDQLKSTKVKKGTTIGANATIICGIELGSYCFIDAGAVVTKDVADHALMTGNPAKQVGWVCKCGKRLDESLACLACGLQFEKFQEQIRIKEIFGGGIIDS